MVGYSSSNSDLHLYRINFSNSSPIWALKMACPSLPCTAYNSNAIKLSSLIYSFFCYGNPRYLYMAIITETDGSVGVRYKSSTTCNNVYGAVISGDYIAASICDRNLLIFNRESNIFITKLFSGTYIFQFALEPTSGRLILGGVTSSNGYSTKFMVQSVHAHPDFQTASSVAMNVLASGTNDITADSGQTIGIVTSQSITPQIYTNQTVSFVSGTSFSSDVNYQTSDLSFSILESISSQITIDLPCSIGGSTAISYSISNYLASTAPTWIVINSLTGILSITSPAVNSDTKYNFYISSSISGVAVPIEKLIKLTVLNCNPSNCQKCVSTNNFECEICNSEYTTVSGKCVLTSSLNKNITETNDQSQAKALKHQQTEQRFFIELL